MKAEARNVAKALGIATLTIGCSESGPAPAPAVGQTQQATHAAALCASAVQGGNVIDVQNDTVPMTRDVYVDAPLAAVAGLTARMPLIPPHPSPFDFSQVYIVNAWNHSAIDYWITNPVAGVDPGFPVTAIAPGVVITASWDPKGFLGNSIVIEHTAPDGTRYRSVYLHLRDGATNDCNNAKTFVDDWNARILRMEIPPADSRFMPFLAYMNAQTCPSASIPAPPGVTVDPVVAWGTDAQTLQVAPGDVVQGGQVIAIAGSTGYGGIGYGLDTSGQVTDPGRANNHLHFFLTYWDGTQWATIDPYGAYTDVSTGCYELGAETEYKRLFAPFYPDHIAIPAAIHGHYQDYYPAMGLALQTASVYQTPRGLEVAGSYQGGLDSLWLAGLGRTQEQFQTLFDDADALGLTLRELSTVIDGETLLFNGIFSERTEPGGWTVLGDTDAQFSETWNNAELAGGRIAEHFVYEFGAVRRHAAVVKADGVNAWQVPWEYSFPDFDNFVDTQVLSGFVPVSVNVEQPASNTYGGVFLQAQGDWAIDVDVPVAGLQAVHNQRIAEGRRLYKIQGYNGGETFSVIYVAGEQRPQAVVRGPFALSCGGSDLTLDGSASTFDSAFPIFYEWSGPFGVIKGQNPSPTVTLAPGTHTLELRVFDSRGFESIASQTVTIEAGAQRYEAENMFASTGGPAPGAWNIWSNGYVSTNHTFTAGATSITVRARGELAQGIAPHMVVSVGGVPIGNVSVTSTTFADYTFSYNAAAGQREIRVAFDNDFYSPPQDRNLVVDRVRVTCAQPTPCSSFCSNPQSISWAGSYQGGNLGTGAICRQTTQAVAGGNCGNFQSPRQLLLNGVPMPCNNSNWPSLPAPVNGGYCLQATAGNHPWAYVTLW